VFKRVRERRILKEANYLDLNPKVRYQHSTDENGIVTVLIPKFKTELFLKLLIPKRRSPHFRAKLDELGSAVWLEIDGKKNVAEVCNQLFLRFGPRIEPVTDRITKFLTSLYRQGLITFTELEERE